MFNTKLRERVTALEREFAQFKCPHKHIDFNRITYTKKFDGTDLPIPEKIETFQKECKDCGKLLIKYKTEESWIKAYNIYKLNDATVTIESMGYTVVKKDDNN